MLTVGITNWNYGHLLDRAINSAMMYADEVLVIDNASTDGSQDIIRSYPVKAVLRKKNKGLISSVNEILSLASCDHLLLLDADDWLCSEPPELGDWCVGSLYVGDEKGDITNKWDYTGWPLNRHDALAMCRLNPTVPVSTRAVFRTSWIRQRGLQYLNFPPGSTLTYGEDVFTSLEWLKTNPVVVRVDEPFYVHTWRGGVHGVNSDEREAEFLEQIAIYLEEAE